ncbi:hypothetical protein F5Y08DRAFT_107 [Xylaria arbuscula]|nr:hypothetical protein F5Y08DRAFT_107 [Xylaria arbuscula]
MQLLHFVQGGNLQTIIMRQLDERQRQMSLLNKSLDHPHSIDMSMVSIFPCFEGTSVAQADLHASSLNWFWQYLEKQLYNVEKTPFCALGRSSAIDINTLQISLAALLDVLRRSEDTSINAILEQMQKSTPGTVLWTSNAAGDVKATDSNNTLLQWIFILLGWTSMLYQPATPSDMDVFEMVLPEASSRPSRFQKHRSSTITSTAKVAETSSIPFPHFFASFGRRLPEEEMIVRSPTLACGSHTNHSLGNITASNIYYSNLRHVGKLKIHWVPDITQHLDLDERNRVLKLFASPSFCALICLSDPESTYPLNLLVMGSVQNYIHLSAFDGTSSSQAQPFDDYCREILLSFGLILARISVHAALHYTSQSGRGEKPFNRINCSSSYVYKSGMTLYCSTSYTRLLSGPTTPPSMTLSSSAASSRPCRNI